MGRFSKLIEKLPRYSAAAGAVGAGAAALMTPEEAQAAGVETIMRKLGVGLEEATKLKKLAHEKVAPGVFEENIRALREVQNQFKNPGDYPLLGTGADYMALQTPNGKVLKIPRSNGRGFIDPTAEYAPSLVEQVGLGPKTKTIQTNDNMYMLQDKVTPLENIIQKAEYRKNDSVLDDLYKQLESNEQRAIDAKRDGNFNKLKSLYDEKNNLDQQLTQRKLELYKQNGIDPAKLEERYSSLDPQTRGRFYNVDSNDPEEMFRQLLKIDAEDKLAPDIVPWDLHAGNVGLNAEGKPTIFDTSRFTDFRPINLSNEQRTKILEANIASPEKKQQLREMLEHGAEDFGTLSDDYSDAVAREPVKPQTLWEWQKNTQGNDTLRKMKKPKDPFPVEGLNAEDKFKKLQEREKLPVETMDSKGKWKNLSKKVAGVAGPAAIGAGAFSGNNATAESLNPIPQIESAFDTVREPIAEATGKVMDYVVDKTTPLYGKDKERYVEETAPIARGAAQMATDPMMYVPGGAELDMALQFPKLRNYLQGK